MARFLQLTNVLDAEMFQLDVEDHRRALSALFESGSVYHLNILDRECNASVLAERCRELAGSFFKMRIET